MTCEKHKTKFEKNAVGQVQNHGPTGSTLRTSVVGVYKCVARDFRRTGKPNTAAEWLRI